MSSVRVPASSWTTKEDNMTNLYAELAKAKTKTGGSKDGDWFLPNQQGSVIVRKVSIHERGLKKTVWIGYEILESNAKVAGVPVQAPGTKVKTAYALHTKEWIIDGLKTDLVNMIGIDEKNLSPADVEEIFKSVFEDKVLVGTVANFSTSLKTHTKDGTLMKTTMTQIYFSEARGEINSEAAIKARAAKIAAEEEPAL